MNLTATIGAGGVLIALACALFATAAATWGQRAGRPPLIAMARRALIATAIFTTLAIGTLVTALLRDDFSLAYVAQVSSRAMLMHMKWASLYSSQAGSLLYWAWITSLLFAVFAWITVPRIPWGAAHAIAVAGGVLAVLLIALAFIASPFRISSITPADGVGLNPLLVDRGMLIHPPFLLAGLASTAVPFTLGAAALLSARTGEAWLRAVRHWALFAWLVLSIGNLLGAWWAYTVLGWGGYWGWDPVENSAILPLLPLTAFLHSAMVQERRGMLKLWNLALVLATFALAVFGTFNVRSGLVASVHSFAQSSVGPYFLVVLAITIVGSVALLAWRAPHLRPDHEFDSLLSRESALIVNNYLLTAIALVILGGTLFPVFSEVARQGRISVGPPFFNDTIGPLLLALLLLLVLGTVLPWRRSTPRTLARRLRAPLATGAIAAVIGLAAGLRDPFALGTVAICVVIAHVTGREYTLAARGVRRAQGGSWPAALSALFERDRRRYGGYLVHLGVAVLAVAVVGSTVYQQQSRAVLAPGESFHAGRYTLRYEGLQQRAGTVNGVQSELVTPVTVLIGTREVAQLAPGRRFFANFPNQPTAIVAVDPGWREDLYLFVQGWDSAGNAEIHAFVNPLMTWLWFGAAIYIAGGLLAFAPVRASMREPARAPAPEAVSP